MNMIRCLKTNLLQPIETSYEAAQHFRSLSSWASVPDTASEQNHAAARKWLSKFSIHTIPRNLCEVTFSRSSGPGGQNVNK